MRILLPVAAAVCLFFPAAVRLPAQSAESIPTTTVNVNEVSLDLTVRDSKGKVVRNLRPEDVQILENGVDQKVQSLRFVEGRDIVAAPAAGGNSKVAPLRTSNLVCIVFHNLDVRTRRFATAVVQEFMAKPLPAGTWIGVFNLGSGLTVLQQFTTDRNVVLQASRKAFTGVNPDFATTAALVNSANPTETSVSGAGGSAGTGSVGSMTISGGELNAAAINGADVSNSQSANIARGQQAEDRQQFGGIAGQQTLDQMQTMIRQLGNLPGHKTVLLLSPGMLTTGVEPDKFKALVTAANSSNMNIYAFDINELDMNSAAMAGNNMTSTAAASGGRTGAGGSMSMDDSAAVAKEGDVLNDAVRSSNMDAPLRALSEGTGGAFAAGSDLRKPFQHIVDDLGAHYEAVYHPASQVWDGRLRTIQVKVRAGLTVESRKAYFALPNPQDLKPYDAPALVALGTTPAPHAFDFGAAAYEFRPEGAASQYAVAFDVDGANMTAAPIPQQKENRLHVTVLALVKDSKGNVVDKLSRDYPLTIADDKLAAAKAESLNATLPFEIAPGQYTVETAVVDFEGHRASTGTLQIDNSGERKGVAMSSLALVSRAEAVSGKVDPANPFEFQGKRMVPLIADKLKPTDQPYVYFVVYPDKTNTEKPQIQVEFLVGGESLAKQTADLPAPDDTGVIPMVVGAAVKPGDCELKITALQGNASVTQDVKYTVAAQ